MGSGDVDASQKSFGMMMQQQQPAMDLMNKRTQLPVRSEHPLHQPR